MDYKQLEDDLVARIVSKIPGSGAGHNMVVIPLPQNQSEFSKPTDFERVVVGYDSSEFDDEIATDVMTQPENIKVVLTLQGFSLRGNTNALGIYRIKKLLKNALMGWTPPDCDKPLRLKYFGPPNNDPAFIDNMWYFELHLVTRSVEVQEYVTPVPTVVSNFTSLNNSNTTITAPLISLAEQ